MIEIFHVPEEPRIIRITPLAPPCLLAPWQFAQDQSPVSKFVRYDSSFQQGIILQHDNHVIDGLLIIPVAVYLQAA